MARIDATLLDRADALLRELPVTRVVRLPHPGIRLHAKMESENRTGSSKDRAAIWILREAVRRGEITRDTTVVESSSGNFALSLASFLDALGVPFVPVLDPNVNAATERTLRRLCARVEKVTEPDGTGGYLLSRLARVARLRAELPDVYWPDQYANPDGARGHYELTAGELLADLGRIDYLFVGVGTGATINGLSRRLGVARPDAKVVAVDVDGSAIFGAPPARRLIPGIGSSIRPPLVDTARIGEVLVLSEVDGWPGAGPCCASTGSTRAARRAASTPPSPSTSPGAPARNRSWRSCAPTAANRTPTRSTPTAGSPNTSHRS